MSSNIFIVIGLLQLSISYWVNSDCVFQESSPFHQSCQIYMYSIVQRTSILHSGMSAGSIVISSASFIILVIFYFYFPPLLSLARCLPTLLIFSKNQHLVSLIFSIVFLLASSLISALVYYFLLSLLFGFILFLFF